MSNKKGQDHEKPGTASWKLDTLLAQWATLLGAIVHATAPGRQ
jgi:hypothetical protein